MTRIRRSLTHDATGPLALCPLCGSSDTISIVYGMPPIDPTNVPGWENVHVGGCIVQAEDRYCRTCQSEFVGPGKPKGGRRPRRL